jgi:hypothetical protein
MVDIAVGAVQVAKTGNLQHDLRQILGFGNHGDNSTRHAATAETRSKLHRTRVDPD